MCFAIKVSDDNGTDLSINIESKGVVGFWIFFEVRAMGLLARNEL